jgi:glycosyltransferase involved in cell wall biosynthesis
MKNNPLVSVLVANYNKEKYINRCLKSLKKQTYKNFEVIFFDDNSADNSIYEVKKNINELNIKIITNYKRKSKYSSFNQINSIYNSYKNSSGEIIFFLDSDDFFHKNKISNIVNFFNKNKEKKIIFDLPYIYYDKNSQKKFKIKNRIFNNIWPHFPPQSCISMKREFFQETFKSISFRKFHNIWFDFRIAFYSYFITKNYYVYNKRLTYYFVDPYGASSEFKYLTLNWWKRRLEAFEFSIFFFNKYTLKLPLSYDYVLTKLICIIFFFKKK